MFVHEQIPVDVCAREPQLGKLGIYRIFDCTPALVQEGICKPDQVKVRERISYCKGGIKSYLGIKDSDLAEIVRRAGIK